MPLSEMCSSAAPLSLHLMPMPAHTCPQAHVPLNEMFGYSTGLRSMTQVGAGGCGCRSRRIPVLHCAALPLWLYFHKGLAQPAPGSKHAHLRTALEPPAGQVQDRDGASDARVYHHVNFHQ